MDIFRKRNSRKGQAAIEFLMTYGWMLLIVLIVGALIFSFIDFGNLLPASIDLSGSFRGDASRMVASETTDEIQLLVRYVGGGSVVVNTTTNAPSMSTNVGRSCTFRHLTDSASPTPNKINSSSTSGVDAVFFVNGQESVITFNCPGLTQGESIDGGVTIQYEDVRTAGLTLTSAGDYRVPVTQ